MRILVLGGCGFIGSHVVDALLHVRHEVRVLDRGPERFRAPLAKVDYRFGDMREPADLSEAMTGVDAVFHLVSTTFPGTADLDPASDVRDNLIGTIGLLETMRKMEIRRLLYLSSGGTVYGAPEVVPTGEDCPLHPIGSYGIVKVAIEHYLELYGRIHGFSSIVLRPSNPFGPRQGHLGVQGAISTFLRRVAANEKIEIWGDGEVVRDFIDVRDLAALCAHAGSSTIEGLYNAGSGDGTSLNDLVALITKVSGRSVDVVYRPGRPVDVPLSILDCSAAARDFEWAPRHSLKDGLQHMWEWLNHPEA